MNTWQRIRQHTWFPWVGIILLMVIATPIMYWNEYESPWGRANQEARLEYMKAKICN